MACTDRLAQALVASLLLSACQGQEGPGLPACGVEPARTFNVCLQLPSEFEDFAGGYVSYSAELTVASAGDDGLDRPCQSYCGEHDRARTPSFEFVTLVTDDGVSFALGVSPAAPALAAGETVSLSVLALDELVGPSCGIRLERATGEPVVQYVREADWGRGIGGPAAQTGSAGSVQLGPAACRREGHTSYQLAVTIDGETIELPSGAERAFAGFRLWHGETTVSDEASCMDCGAVTMAEYLIVAASDGGAGPDAPRPDASSHDTSLPEAAQPGASRPDASQPGASRPDVSQPEHGNGDGAD